MEAVRPSRDTKEDTLSLSESESESETDYSSDGSEGPLVDSAVAPSAIEDKENVSDEESAFSDNDVDIGAIIRELGDKNVEIESVDDVQTKTEIAQFKLDIPEREPLEYPNILDETVPESPVVDGLRAFAKGEIMTDITFPVVEEDVEVPVTNLEYVEAKSQKEVVLSAENDLSEEQEDSIEVLPSIAINTMEAEEDSIEVLPSIAINTMEEEEDSIGVLPSIAINTMEDEEVDIETIRDGNTSVVDEQGTTSLEENGVETNSEMKESEVECTSDVSVHSIIAEGDENNETTSPNEEKISRTEEPKPVAELEMVPPPVEISSDEESEDEDSETDTSGEYSSSAEKQELETKGAQEGIVETKETASDEPALESKSEEELVVEGSVAELDVVKPDSKLEAPTVGDEESIPKKEPVVPVSSAVEPAVEDEVLFPNSKQKSLNMDDFIQHVEVEKETGKYEPTTQNSIASLAAFLIPEVEESVEESTREETQEPEAPAIETVDTVSKEVEEQIVDQVTCEEPVASSEIETTADKADSADKYDTEFADFDLVISDIRNEFREMVKLLKEKCIASHENSVGVQTGDENARVVFDRVWSTDRSEREFESQCEDKKIVSHTATDVKAVFSEVDAGKLKEALGHVRDTLLLNKLPSQFYVQYQRELIKTYIDNFLQRSPLFSEFAENAPVILREKNDFKKLEELEKEKLKAMLMILFEFASPDPSVLARPVPEIIERRSKDSGAGKKSKKKKKAIEEEEEEYKERQKRADQVYVQSLQDWETQVEKEKLKMKEFRDFLWKLVSQILVNLHRVMSYQEHTELLDILMQQRGFGEREYPLLLFPVNWTESDKNHFLDLFAQISTKMYVVDPIKKKIVQSKGADLQDFEIVSRDEDISLILRSLPWTRFNNYLKKIVVSPDCDILKEILAILDQCNGSINRLVGMMNAFGSMPRTLDTLAEIMCVNISGIVEIYGNWRMFMVDLKQASQDKALGNVQVKWDDFIVNMFIKFYSRAELSYLLYPICVALPFDMISYSSHWKIFYKVNTLNDNVESKINRVRSFQDWKQFQIGEAIEKRSRKRKKTASHLSAHPLVSLYGSTIALSTSKMLEDAASLEESPQTSPLPPISKRETIKKLSGKSGVPLEAAGLRILAVVSLVAESELTRIIVNELMQILYERGISSEVFNFITNHISVITETKPETISYVLHVISENVGRMKSTDMQVLLHKLCIWRWCPKREDLDMLLSLVCSPAVQQLKDSGMVQVAKNFLENVNWGNLDFVPTELHRDFAILVCEHFSKIKKKDDEAILSLLMTALLSLRLHSSISGIPFIEKSNPKMEIVNSIADEPLGAFILLEATEIGHSYEAWMEGSNKLLQVLVKRKWYKGYCRVIADCLPYIYSNLLARNDVATVEKEGFGLSASLEALMRIDKQNRDEVLSGSIGRLFSHFLVDPAESPDLKPRQDITPRSVGISYLSGLARIFMVELRKTTKNVFSNEFTAPIVELFLQCCVVTKDSRMAPAAVRKAVRESIADLLKDSAHGLAEDLVGREALMGEKLSHLAFEALLVETGEESKERRVAGEEIPRFKPKELKRAVKRAGVSKAIKDFTIFTWMEICCQLDEKSYHTPFAWQILFSLLLETNEDGALYGEFFLLYRSKDFLKRLKDKLEKMCGSINVMLSSYRERMKESEKSGGSTSKEPKKRDLSRQITAHPSGDRHHELELEELAEDASEDVTEDGSGDLTDSDVSRLTELIGLLRGMHSFLDAGLLRMMATGGENELLKKLKNDVTSGPPEDLWHHLTEGVEIRLEVERSGLSEFNSMRASIAVQESPFQHSLDEISKDLKRGVGQLTDLKDLFEVNPSIVREEKIGYIPSSEFTSTSSFTERGKLLSKKLSGIHVLRNKWPELDATYLKYLSQLYINNKVEKSYRKPCGDDCKGPAIVYVSFIQRVPRKTVVQSIHDNRKLIGRLRRKLVFPSDMMQSVLLLRGTAKKTVEDLKFRPHDPAFKQNGLNLFYSLTAIYSESIREFSPLAEIFNEMLSELAEVSICGVRDQLIPFLKEIVTNIENIDALSQFFQPWKDPTQICQVYDEILSLIDDNKISEDVLLKIIGMIHPELILKNFTEEISSEMYLLPVVEKILNAISFRVDGRGIQSSPPKRVCSMLLGQVVTIVVFHPSVLLPEFTALLLEKSYGRAIVPEVWNVWQSILLDPADRGHADAIIKTFLAVERVLWVFRKRLSVDLKYSVYSLLQEYIPQLARCLSGFLHLMIPALDGKVAPYIPLYHHRDVWNNFVRSIFPLVTSVPMSKLNPSVQLVESAISPPWAPNDEAIATVVVNWLSREFVAITTIDHKVTANIWQLFNTIAPLSPPHVVKILHAQLVAVEWGSLEMDSVVANNLADCLAKGSGSLVYSFAMNVLLRMRIEEYENIREKDPQFFINVAKLAVYVLRGHKNTKEIHTVLMKLQGLSWEMLTVDEYLSLMRFLNDFKFSYSMSNFIKLLFQFTTGCTKFMNVAADGSRPFITEEIAQSMMDRISYYFTKFIPSSLVRMESYEDVSFRPPIYTDQLEQEKISVHLGNITKIISSLVSAIPDTLHTTAEVVIMKFVGLINDFGGKDVFDSVFSGFNEFILHCPELALFSLSLASKRLTQAQFIPSISENCITAALSRGKLGWRQISAALEVPEIVEDDFLSMCANTRCILTLIAVSYKYEDEKPLATHNLLVKWVSDVEVLDSSSEQKHLLLLARTIEHFIDMKTDQARDHLNTVARVIDGEVSPKSKKRVSSRSYEYLIAAKAIVAFVFAHLDNIGPGSASVKGNSPGGVAVSNFHKTRKLSKIHSVMIQEVESFIKDKHSLSDFRKLKERVFIGLYPEGKWMLMT